MPIPHDAVHVDLRRRRRARMCLSEALMSDQLTFENALALGLSYPSSVDFDVKWQGQRPLQTVRDRENRFKYQYFTARATIAWSYVRSGRAYVSDPRGQTTRFAAIGFEENGKFFD
jgi:hypothetical protein